jgi:hypothetical protein
MPPATWGPGEIEQLRGRLGGAGLSLEFADGRLTVRRAPRG